MGKLDGKKSLITGSDSGIGQAIAIAFAREGANIVVIKRDEGGKGKIINISSVHEDIPLREHAAYNSAKGAVRNFMRSLTLELAEDGIIVNNIAPDMTLTPMNQEAIDDPVVRKEQTKDIPLQRAAQPEEIAPVAILLASSDSDYITGSTYYIDGGLMQNIGHS